MIPNDPLGEGRITAQREAQAVGFARDNITPHPSFRMIPAWYGVWALNTASLWSEAALRASAGRRERNMPIPEIGFEKHAAALRGLSGRLAMLGLIVAAGCSDEGDEPAGEEPFTVLARVSGWTPWTSEESPPISCDSLIGGFEFAGKYSDNVRARCFNQGGTVRARWWVGPVSEEGAHVWESGVPIGPAASCDHIDRLGRQELGLISGVSCTGKYCDNISVQCSVLDQSASSDYHNCYTTNWVSEEYGGNIDFKAGFFATAVECTGDYCDSMRFKVCQLLPRDPDS